MTDLAILLPVLRRPHRVEPLLESIEETVPGAHVVFLCDHDDFEMQGAIYDTGAEMHAFEGANYARKINEGVRLTEESYLFFGADDLKFWPGWFENARHWIDQGYGVVATEDLCNPRVARGELATHPLVARWYATAETIDGSDGPLHEGYVHEYVDREFSEVARARKAFVYEPLAVVEHLHPMVGKAPEDDIYRQLRYRMVKGRRLYSRRHSQWKSRLQ